MSLPKGQNINQVISKTKISGIMANKKNRKKSISER